MTILDVGVSVELHGLSAAKHNGLKGRVVSPLNEKGRWTVQLEQSENKLALKPGNLKVTGPGSAPPPSASSPPARARAQAPGIGSCFRRLFHRALIHPRRFLRRLYVAFASEPAFGLPSPASLELCAVRSRCDAQLRIWGLRMLAARMQDHIKTKTITVHTRMI